MSNNIYDILKKFNNLDSAKITLTESAKECKVCGMKNCKCEDKKHESKKKDKVKESAIAEAIAQVEQQLNEKYMGFKKAAAADKKMVKELDPNYKAPESDYFHSREKMAPVAAWDNDEQGQKQYKDRTAPGVINKVKDFVGYDKPNPAYGPRDTKVKEGDYNEDMLSPGQKKIAKMSPPPNKIDANDLAALRAGKKKKEEGNEFSGELAQAKAQHKKEFSVGGKTYPVKEGFPTVDDAKKRMDDREGKTSHGKKTTTKTGVKHERDYDAVDKGADVDSTPKGRGRPKKDRFA